MSIFEGLSGKLQETIKKLRSKGRVTDRDVKEIMREIKLALLEADVNFKVVKEFINSVSERAVGQDVLESLTPGQQVIKIVHEELIKLMGGDTAKITFSPKPPTVYMMVGLQGSGKTTTSGKLGNILRKQGKNPLLVACDIYRTVLEFQFVSGNCYDSLDIVDFCKIGNCLFNNRKPLYEGYAVQYALVNLKHDYITSSGLREKVTQLVQYKPVLCYEGIFHGWPVYKYRFKYKSSYQKGYHYCNNNSLNPLYDFIYDFNGFNFCHIPHPKNFD
jgi:hypothetical protein